MQAKKVLCNSSTEKKASSSITRITPAVGARKAAETPAPAEASVERSETCVK